MSTAPRHQRTTERRFTRNARRRATALLSSLALMASMGFAVPAAVADGDDAAGVVGPSSPAFQTLDVTAEPTDPAPEQTEDAPSPAPETSAPVETQDPADNSGDSAPSDVDGDSGVGIVNVDDGTESLASTPAEDESFDGQLGEGDGDFGILAAGPDGATAPYVYWTVKDASDALVGGATFQLQGPRSSGGGGGNWGTTVQVVDCTSAPASCPADSIDRDPDPGEFAVENIGNHRISSSNRYRLQRADAPSGYQFSDNRNGWQSIPGNGGTPSNNMWRNGTYDFENFSVSERAGTRPQCLAGYIYSINGAGQIRQVTASGVSTMGSSAGQSNMNALGISAGGQQVFAVKRDGGSSNSDVDIWQYNTANGTWSEVMEDVSVERGTGNSRQTGIVAGAVDLSTGEYYFGGYAPNGQTFRIWRYRPTTQDVQYVGHIATTVGASSSSNGDMAFDASGTLFVVRGVGTTTNVFSVTKNNLANAPGNDSRSIPASHARNVTTMSSVNGVAFDSSGKSYLGASEQVRSYNMPNWSNAVNFATSGLSSSTDLSSCSSPPTITVEKYIQGDRVNSGDQFELRLHQGAQLIDDATTSGSASQLQEERIGPLPTVRGAQLTFSEVGAGSTDLTQYATSYQCRVDGELEDSMSGNGTIRTITYPADADTVNCIFYNAPLIASVVVHKDVADVDGENKVARAGWSVGATAAATTGTVAKTPAANTQVTNASGDASWSLKFGAYADRATVTVQETQQSGYEFLSGQCVVTHLDGSTTETVLTSEAPQALTGIAPGDTIDCTYINKPKAGSVSWKKVDDSTPAVLLGGSEWTITGPGFPADGALITDCTAAGCTGLDKDPAEGQFTLEDLVWGTYTVTETRAPTGHALDTPANTFTFEVTSTNLTFDKGPFVNPRLPGSVIWTKVDDQDPAGLLGGSEWTITGPGFTADNNVIVDCTAATCTGLDKDPVAGQFKLEGLAWGTYTVTETSPPDGYAGNASFQFTIDAESVDEVIDGGSHVNARAVGSVTWQKVDDSTPPVHLEGSEWVITGPAPDATEQAVTDCVAAEPAGCEAAVDNDHRAGHFHVEDLAWGDYTLTETKAPAGYEFEPTAHSFTIGADNLDHEFEAAFVNTRRDGPNLPLTGGLGRDFFTILGIGVLTAGVGTVGYFQIRDRRREVA